MKGPQILFLLQKPLPTTTDLTLTWAGNLKLARSERRGNKSHKDRMNLIYSFWRKNRRFGVSPVLSTVLLTRNCFAQKHRRRLVQELSARMERDQQLRYAERELEMQRLLMGKGRTKKLKGVEVVKGESDEDEGDGEVDEDRPARSTGKTYKPRVYKWKAERKR